MITGSGPALVNGVPTQVVFTANMTAGAVTFQVLDSSSMTVLAGGTGEPGRSTLDLAIAPNF
jgi:hypothetical protein